MADGIHTVLIHGACHSAWCWQGVQSQLVTEGWSVSSLDMPGCGEDKTPRQDIRFNDQVTAVCDHIRGVGAKRFRLVGHSIAGWILPAVVTQLSLETQRVEDIVFVASSILNRGERGIDVIPEDRRYIYYDMASQSADYSVLMSFDAAWPRFYNHLSQTDARIAYKHLKPQPFAPYLEPAPVGIEDIDTPRAYIAVDEDFIYPLDVAMAFAAKAKVEPFVIAGDHCLMVSDPTGLAHAIQEVASEGA